MLQIYHNLYNRLKSSSFSAAKCVEALFAGFLHIYSLHKLNYLSNIVG